MVRCQPEPDEDSFLEPDPRAQVKRDYTEQRNRSAGVGAGFVLLKGWLKKGHLGNKKDDHTVLELISVQRLMTGKGDGEKRTMSASECTLMDKKDFWSSSRPLKDMSRKKYGQHP